MDDQIVAHGWQESRPNRSNIPDHGRASASAAQAALGGVGESSEPSRGLAEEMEMTNDDPLEDALERAPLVLDRPLLFLCHAAFDSEGALRLGRQCYGWCESVRVEEPTTPVVFNGLGLAEGAVAGVVGIESGVVSGVI